MRPRAAPLRGPQGGTSLACRNEHRDRQGNRLTLRRLRQDQVSSDKDKLLGLLTMDTIQRRLVDIVRGGKDIQIVVNPDDRLNRVTLRVRGRRVASDFARALERHFKIQEQ